MSHTPGPWSKISTNMQDPFLVRRIVGPNGEKIATVTCTRIMDKDDALDNAALIYAAPDLLAAAEAQPNPDKKLLAAISKARGWS